MWGISGRNRGLPLPSAPHTPGRNEKILIKIVFRSVSPSHPWEKRIEASTKVQLAGVSPSHPWEKRIEASTKVQLAGVSPSHPWEKLAPLDGRR
jgi:hypothetical protein